MSTMYASFVDAASAEKAAGALLDQGATSSDISIVANIPPNSVHAVNAIENASEAEHAAKSGISTTTGTDAATGAVKGVGIGIGVGIAAALATLFVPGIGLVLGGGALATAMAGGAATAVAGGAAGGVVGYLHDQGVPESMVTHYNDHFMQGGAIVAISVPTGSLATSEIEAYLLKYGAMNIATYNSANVRVDTPLDGRPAMPLVIDNPRIDPIAIAPVEVIPTPVRAVQIVDAQTGESRIVHAEVEPGVPVALPNLNDPLAGEVEDPLIAPKADLY